MVVAGAGLLFCFLPFVVAIFPEARAVLLRISAAPFVLRYEHKPKSVVELMLAKEDTD